MTSTDDAYDELLERAERIAHVDDADELLAWDQEVAMPEGGTPARARQRAALSGITHDLLTAAEVGESLDAIDPGDLDGDRTAVVRELRRRHEREASVPESLVERHAAKSSEARQVWREAKADADFAAFAPTLAELRELRVERADLVDPDATPYEAMYDDQMPTLPLDAVESVLDELVDGIVPLVEEIRERGDELARPFADRTVPEDEQAALGEAALDLVGYDREHGRLDVSAHPFTSGTQFDARITTRYDPEDPVDGLLSTLHEFGHAAYALGLPRDAYGSPLGTARDEVHESQSRFWENHVGRSRAFWETFRPTLVEHCSGTGDVSADALYEHANRIAPGNPIRVEADELTYHLHVAVRTTIEREFVDGDLSVDGIPEQWGDLMEEHLGVRPEDDATGALQDIHWTTRFGGFQTYTVGSVIAAQLDAAMREDLDVEGCIRDRAFGRLDEWMTEHVHRHGQRYETPELIERATGSPLSADAFLEYANGKFRALYGL